MEKAYGIADQSGLPRPTKPPPAPQPITGTKPTMGDCLRILEMYPHNNDYHGLDEEIIHIAQLRIIELFERETK